MHWLKWNEPDTVDVGIVLFAQEPLGPRANMECQAGMPGTVTVAMF